MMPKDQPTASKKARRAANAGDKFSAALRDRIADQAADNPLHNRLAQVRSQLDRNYAEFDEQLGDGPMDPYTMAWLLRARAGLWYQLAEAHGDLPHELSAACTFAAILEEERAARIMYVNRIPTTLPGSMQALLHLDEMVCDECGQPWQTDRPCPNCPQILVGATGITREEAGKLPPGTPWHDGERLTPASKRPTAASRRPRVITRPRWHTPGPTPAAQNALADLLRSDPPAIGPEWRTLITALAESRSELTAHQISLEDADGPSAAAIAVALENGRVRYVHLANHALAAAAGDTEPAALPQDTPMGVKGFAEIEPAVPQALASAGFRLVLVRSMLPPSQRTALALQERYEDEYTHRDPDPAGTDLSNPRARAAERRYLSDRIGRAWQDVADEQVIWADAVCVELAGELRPLTAG